MDHDASSPPEPTSGGSLRPHGAQHTLRRGPSSTSLLRPPVQTSATQAASGMQRSVSSSAIDASPAHPTGDDSAGAGEARSNPHRRSMWSTIRRGVDAAHALRRNAASQQRSAAPSVDDEGMSAWSAGLDERSRSLSSSSSPSRRLRSSDEAANALPPQWANLADLVDSSREQARPRSTQRSSNAHDARRRRSSRLVEGSDGPGARVEGDRRDPPSRAAQGGATTGQRATCSSEASDPHAPVDATTLPSADRSRNVSAQSRQPPPPPPTAGGRRLASLSDEPESFISSDPEDIPVGEDPLFYTDAKADHLLSSDSDSDSDSGPGSDREDGGQSRRGSRKKGARGSSRSRSGWLQRATSWRPTRLQKNILKCSLAYFLGSLFTFSPLLSDFLASRLPSHDADAKVPISNLHMVATVATYFHPGRTAGSMLEANLFAALAFAYALVVGLVSMSIAVALHEYGLPVLSNAISVLVFLGVGVALLGYAKIVVAKPSFNIACSLVCVIVFTVVVKEGSRHLGHFSTDKTWQVTLVVLAGVLCSNLVNFGVWPQSACTNLQHDIERNLHSFSTLLKVLTRTFLLDDPAEFHMRSSRIRHASENHHASFTSLKRNLSEARLEAPFDARMRSQIDSYGQAVDSLNRLAQHLNGLRSSCSLQQDLISSKTALRAATAANTSSRPGGDGATAAGEQTPIASTLEDAKRGIEEKSRQFSGFLDSVGPHMRSLVFTCCRTMGRLQAAFVTQRTRWTRAEGSPNDVEPAIDSFEPLETDLRDALRRFQREQTVAIKRLYTFEPALTAAASSSAERPADGDDAPAALAAQMLGNASRHADEEVFLIFYFVFLLEEFASELSTLLRELENIRKLEVRLWEREQRRWPMRLLGRVWALVAAPSAWFRRKGRRGASRPLFSRSSAALDWPSNKRHQLNTAQTPAATTFKARLSRLVWSTGQFLRRAETKFAVKAGMGSAVLAVPAFLDSTRHVFNEFQGQWALVSFMVVLSPTVGQSNQMSLHRTLGTMFGASTAYGAYRLFPDDNVALPIFGFLLSLPAFYYIVARPHLASTARFVLLSYNLTALYSYNLRVVGVEVEEIALRRSVSVIVGVLWATILNHLLWPFEARRELLKGISDLLFKLAWLYQKLVLTYSSRRELEEDGSDGFAHNAEDLERQPLLQRKQTQPSASEMQAMELELQVTLIKLEGLLAQTKHEPRLKGPFPVATYRRYLECCQNVLDKLHSMRCVTHRQDWHTSVRRDFIVPVDAGGLRREMVGNVLLYFWLLASVFDLKTPLPPYMPPAERSRLALVEAIRELPAVQRRAVRGSSEYLLYFAYALSMKDLIAQLEEMGRCAQDTFGVLGGSAEAFERQFRPNAASAKPTPRPTLHRKVTRKATRRDVAASG